MNEVLKKQAIRRLKILEGQIRGIQNMVFQGKYCIDILRQSAAAKEALSGIENMLLENHLKIHAFAQARAGKGKKALKEILAVYKLSKQK